MRLLGLLLLVFIWTACDKTPPPEPTQPSVDEKTYDNWTGGTSMALLLLGDRMLWAGSRNGSLWVSEWSATFQLLHTATFSGPGESGARFMIQEGAGVLIGGYRKPDANTEQGALWRYTPGGTIALIANYGQLGETTFLNDGLKLPSNDRLLTGYRTVNGNRDVWIARVDLPGNLVWERTYGGSAVDGGHRLYDGPSNIWVYGYTESRGAGGRDLWLMQLDGNLDTAYTFTVGGAGYEQPGGLVFAANGDLIIAAHTASTDPMHNTGTFRVTQQGTEVWRTEYGGTAHDGTEDILTLDNGNYLVLGNTESYGAGQSDAVLLEVANDGAIIDTFITGTADFDEGIRVINGSSTFWIAGRRVGSSSESGFLLQWSGF